MTKSSIDVANTTMRLAKIAGPSSGSSTSRIACRRVAPRSRAASSYWVPMADEAAANDDHDERQRERDVTEQLRGEAAGDAGVDLREHEEQRDADHDLGRHEREQHQAVRPGRRAGPASDAGRSPSPRRSGYGDQHRTAPRAAACSSSRCCSVVVVPHRRRAGRPSTSGTTRAGTSSGCARVERDAHATSTGQQRPQDVQPRDDGQPASAAVGAADEPTEPAFIGHGRPLLRGWW